ncbi:MAG: ArdC family protein [Cyclobacteriaceae bacterium]|nr:ArdC family protein [Cyclobacteriaceae bacterium]
MKTSSKQIDVYQIVTDLIIEKLESGIIPWQKPWSDYGPAVNYVTRKPYRGINQLILNGLHTRPYYLTFQQAIDLGGSVKKGSKSIPVTYWNILYRQAGTTRNLTAAEANKLPNDQVERVAFLKYSPCFQCR